MIKLLYVTPHDPLNLDGGAIGNRKLLYPLINLHKKCKIELSLITLANNKKEYLNKNCDIDSLRTLTFSRSRINAILSRILLMASELELHKKDILDFIIKYSPDVIIFQNSRQGRIIKRLIDLKNKKKVKRIFVIQHFDNFEYEATNFYKKILPFPLNLIESLCAYWSEYNAIKYCDYGIFLHSFEAEKIMNFYDRRVNYSILPLYYDNMTDSGPDDLGADNNLIEFIFTGTLRFYPNEEAAIFLIEMVKALSCLIEDKYGKKMRLTIMGSNPRKALYKKIESIKENNLVRIISEPNAELAKIIFNRADIYLSPVFLGPGMKTKVLEAIYHGIPVVASKTSLRGYESIFEYFGKGIFPFNDLDKNGFVTAVEDAIKFIRSSEKEKIRGWVKDIYRNKFKIEMYEETIEKIIRYSKII